MDFAWNEDQLAIREAATEFGARMLVEGVEARDRSGAFSHDAWAACADFGLAGLFVPERWGGGEQDLLTAVATFEGIGRGALDNGTVFAVAAHAASCAGPILDYGSEDQKDHWLPRLADGSTIGAAAITEPGSGSNALGLGTSAETAKDGWVLNGSKTFVSNAPMADLFLVYARTAPGGLAGLIRTAAIPFH